MMADFLITFLPMLLFFGWPLLSLVTLFNLRSRPLTGLNQLLWALTILFIPIFGAITYWIIQPKE